MFKTLSTAILTLALAASALAQCPMPDSLDGGPCCAPTQVTLPNFPKIKHDCLDICWRDCDISNVGNGTVRWSRPNGTSGSCAARYSTVRMYDPAGVITWRGRMRMNYSRTWFEIGAANNTYQVWRFLVNGDMRPTTAAGAIPCPVPSCVAVHNKARYSGYVDYALDCNTGDWSSAWMLTHACDKVEHVAGFPRGTGPYHPDRSFTFVGPAAGFAPTPMVAGEGGGSTFDAVRKIRIGSATSSSGTTVPVAVCTFEERIDHQLAPNNQYCLCAGSANTVPQWQESTLHVGSMCGTVIDPSGTYMPPYLSMGIGFWTDPMTYPGPEQLRFNVGDYRVIDGCTGNVKQENYFGVTTIEGFPAHQINNGGIGAPLPPTFVDQCNSVRKNGTHVLNIPFLTSRVLNLNH